MLNADKIFLLLIFYKLFSLIKAKAIPLTCTKGSYEINYLMVVVSPSPLYQNIHDWSHIKNQNNLKEVSFV